MTHIRNGTEYLDGREMRIWKAVRTLNELGRTTNSSQVAARARLSRTTVTFTCGHLAARGFLRNDNPDGKVYHWRVTGTIPVQDPETIREEPA